MRIFILHNKTKAGNYAEALYKLLLQLLAEQNFIITETGEITQIQQADLPTLNTALVFHTEKKTPSFFARLKLQNTIGKNGITNLVQVTDSMLLSTKLPQLIITDYPQNIAVKSLQKSFVATCSETCKLKIKEEKPEMPPEQIHVIPLAADDKFQSISWSGQQAVKMQYTQGREYFLTSAEGKTLQSFTELLKAFSVFKKWQHSNMKLVVTGRLLFTGTEEWKEKISTYKFRDDIVLPDKINGNDIVDITGSAYVYLHTPNADNDILPLLQATKCGTPCLSFKTGSIEEYFNEPAMLVEPDNYDQLAEKMILLYKDEALRSRLIAKGKEVAEQYSKDKTFAALAGVLSLPFH